MCDSNYSGHEFRTALAANFKSEYKNKKVIWKQRPGIGGACGPGKLGLVLDETERLPCGKGGKGTLASSIRPEPRTTASTGAVCTDIHNLFGY